MASSRRQYPFHLIEPKWQKNWDEQQSFRAFNPNEEIPANHPFATRHKVSGKVVAAQLPPKFYILDMFPYPSGRGLARRASRRLHRHGHSRPLQTRARFQRAASDGLGTRSVCPPSNTRQDRATSAPDHRGKHCEFQTTNSIARLQLRLVARTRHDRPGLFPVDAVDFSEAL